MADFAPYVPPVLPDVAPMAPATVETAPAPVVSVEAPPAVSVVVTPVPSVPEWKKLASDVHEIGAAVGVPAVATAETVGTIPANVAPVATETVAAVRDVAGVVAVAPDPAAAVLAGANVVISAESGWETSEGQMSLAFKAGMTALGTLVATDQLSLPATVKGWVLAGIAVAVAVEQGAYAVGRSVRKRGTAK